MEAGQSGRVCRTGGFCALWWVGGATVEMPELIVWGKETPGQRRVIEQALLREIPVRRRIDFHLGKDRQM